MFSSSNRTIERIVLKPPRAIVLQSHGNGFGSHLERVINAAYGMHRNFTTMLVTVSELIDFLRTELDENYPHDQFSIVVGQQFDFDAHLSRRFALLELAGWHFLIFSSIGCSYRVNADDVDPYVW
jgi:hypothetical protein